MKKILSLILIFATFTFVLPKQEAKAGVGIITYATVGGAQEHKPEIGFLIGLVMAGVYAFPLTIIGGVTAIFAPAIGMPIVYGSLVLAADGSPERDQLVGAFTEKYNFIDNQAVLNELANVIKAKFKQSPAIPYVRLSESETRQILDPAMLSESEIQAVIADLK